MKWMFFTSLFLMLSCCAKKPTEKPQEKASDPNKPRLVGRIASISPDKKFALIQAYGTWNVETGKILASHGGNGRSANLLVTGEKLGQFAAADIQSGEIEIGDATYTAAIVPEKEDPAVMAESEIPPL
jgi:hypothetical protein